MPPRNQLPATLKPGTLTTPADSHLVPALIADAGEPAAWRYIEFFTANIRNPNKIGAKVVTRVAMSPSKWPKSPSLEICSLIRFRQVDTPIQV